MVRVGEVGGGGRKEAVRPSEVLHRARDVSGRGVG